MQQQQQQRKYEMNPQSFDMNNMNANMGQTMCMNNNSNHNNNNNNNNNFKNMNDAFMNSILHELKSIKINDSSNETSFSDKRICGTERAIVKSNEYNKLTNGHGKHSSAATNMSSMNQWTSPQSPNSSIKSLYHKSDSYSTSKESLWASTQSSPNSAQREQLKNQFKKSASTPANLWESPNSKMSQATLMIKNDSNSSVWCTPPQIQSPAVSNGQNYWDCSSTSSILNRSADSFSSDSGISLLRPQDLSPNDIWSNTPKNLSIKTDTNGSMWSNTSPIGKIEPIMYTSTPLKSTAPLDNVHHIDRPTMNGMNGMNGMNVAVSRPLTSASATPTSTTNPASSSCLQLFSDDFINYLNMIN